MDKLQALTEVADRLDTLTKNHKIISVRFDCTSPRDLQIIVSIKKRLKSK